jgi:hypothetical protein
MCDGAGQPAYTTQWVGRHATIALLLLGIQGTSLADQRLNWMSVPLKRSPLLVKSIYYVGLLVLGAGRGGLVAQVLPQMQSASDSVVTTIQASRWLCADSSEATLMTNVGSFGGHQPLPMCAVRRPREDYRRKHSVIRWIQMQEPELGSAVRCPW